MEGRKRGGGMEGRKRGGGMEGRKGEGDEGMYQTTD